MRLREFTWRKSNYTTSKYDEFDKPTIHREHPKLKQYTILQGLGVVHEPDETLVLNKCRWPRTLQFDLRISKSHQNKLWNFLFWYSWDSSNSGMFGWPSFECILYYTKQSWLLYNVANSTSHVYHRMLKFLYWFANDLVNAVPKAQRKKIHV